MTEAQFRNKVIWFSFVFSLLVVWAHSENAELFLGITEEMAAVYRVEQWLIDYVAQIAVPGFFMISGYLFYRDFTWERLGEKWNRRIKSILVPFILWNGIYYLGYVTASRLPGLTQVLGKGTVPFTVEAAVDAVIHYRYNYVFWYLHQLAILTILAPFFWCLLRTRWGSAVLVLVPLWLAAENRHLPFLNLDASIYYGSGAALAAEMRRWKGKPYLPEKNKAAGKWHITQLLPERLWNVRRALAGIFCLALAGVSYYAGLVTAVMAGFILCRLLAVAGLWLLVPGDKLPPARDFMCHNFFLYATHFAFVRLINKGMAMLFPVAVWEPLVLFILMPGLVLGISTFLGWILRRYLPGLWRLLNGYRV